MSGHRVAIERMRGGYPSRPPFLAGRAYPELPGSGAGEANASFDAVRQLLLDLRLDPVHVGTARWNPLAEVIRSGQTVFIKPNMVDHEHRFHADLWSVITHPSVVWAVAEYVALALGGSGRILVGDNPHVDCRWEVLRELYRPDLLADHLRARYGVETEFVDLRSRHVPDLADYGFKLGTRPLAGDPRGEVAVDLGRASMLNGIPWWLLRGTFHERLDTIRAHTLGRNRYVFSRTIFDADVLVSIPKLKAHAKVGATLNVKGLVGTIADKNGLVHWRLGFPALGGDEYPPPEDRRDYLRLYGQHLLAAVTPASVYFHVRRRLKDTGLGRLYRRIMTCEAQRLRVLRGAWDGNDTTWRMAVDIYRALVEPRLAAGRRCFSIVDGGVAGDTDGPHFPQPRAAGVLVGGDDLLAVDLVSLRLMDYRLEQVRHLAHLASRAGLGPGAIEVLSSSYDTAGFFDPQRRHLEFRPPHRWPALSLHQLAPGPSFLPERG